VRILCSIIDLFSYNIMSSVVIVSRYFAPGYQAGGPIQSVSNILTHIQNKSIILVTTNADRGAKEPYHKEELSKTKSKFSNAIVYVNTITFSLYAVLKVVLKVRPDTIYFNSYFDLSTAIFMLLRRLVSPMIRILIAPRGELHKGAIQYKNMKKTLYINAYAKLLLGNAILEFHATDNKEADCIRDFHPNTYIHTIQNISRKPTLQKISEKTSRFLFYSRIHPKKNLDGLLEQIQRYENYFNKGIDLDIYGPIDDYKYWDLCSKKASAMRYSSIKYHGPVPNTTMQSIMPNYSAMILLSHGENFGHVIYESIASGLPVIISKHTPWTSIIDEKAGYVVESYSEFIRAIHEITTLNNVEYVNFRNSVYGMANSYYNMYMKDAIVDHRIMLIREGKYS